MGKRIVTMTMLPWTHFGHCWFVRRHIRISSSFIFILTIEPHEQEEGWQTKQAAAEDRPFDGYQLRDLIVEKWTVPYDVQFKREVFMGKPMLFLNVMWKYEGQMSFPLTEQVPIHTRMSFKVWGHEECERDRVISD